MPAVDAPPAALRTVLAVLERHVPDREVRVMGSRVTGAAKPFSDLDLAFKGIIGEQSQLFRTATPVAPAAAG